MSNLISRPPAAYATCVKRLLVASHSIQLTKPGRQEMPSGVLADLGAVVVEIEAEDARVDAVNAAWSHAGMCHTYEAKDE